MADPTLAGNGHAAARLNALANPSRSDLIRLTEASLSIIITDGQVAEMRALGVRQNGNRWEQNESGFWDRGHLRKMASEAHRLSPWAKGVFFTINPLKKDLVARRCCRMDRAKEGEGAADRHVHRRRWLYLDVDPIRDRLISSTDEEKGYALDTVRAIRTGLSERGFPDPILGDSGNGGFALYRIDLANDEQSTSLLKRVLRALAQRFDSERAEVDQSVYNAARMMKVPWTWAHKGDNTAERPHRRSRLLEIPGCADPLSPESIRNGRVEVVPAAILEALAAEAPEEPAKGTRPPGGGGQTGGGQSGGQSNGQYTHRLMVEAWLRDRGVGYSVKATEGDGRTVYVLEQCPFDESHRHPDACVMQDANGRLSARCFHNSCQGRGWQQFKEAIGKPGAEHYDPPFTPQKQKQKRKRQRATLSLPATPVRRAAGMTAAESAAYTSPTPPPLEPIVSPAGIPPQEVEPPAPGGVAAGDPNCPPPVRESLTNPHRLARHWMLRDGYCHEPGDRIAFFRGAWWEWQGFRWRSTPDSDLRPRMNRFIRQQLERDMADLGDLLRAEAEGEDGADGGQDPTIPSVTGELVSNVLQALGGQTLVPADTPFPSWRGEAPGPRDWVAVRNGILDVAAFLADSDDCVREHTPCWFSPVCLPYDFDPQADCPRWRAFLGRNLGDDPEKARLLQQWAGYLLLPDTCYQRYLLMVGEGDNGKSVACGALTAMLGEDNVSAVGLESFGDRFKLHGTLGRLANIVPEVGELDKMAEGLLKAYVVGEPMPFEEKFKQPFCCRPTARLMLATNNIPAFSDKSDGIWRRTLLMPFGVQIPAAEKIPGMDKPSFWGGERSGLLNWALAGLRDLRAAGGFVVPASCRAALDRQREDVNPARRFLIEHYQAGGGEAVKGDLYREYAAWCEVNHHRQMASNTFGKEVVRAFKTVVDGKSAVGPTGKRANVWRGLDRRDGD